MSNLPLLWMVVPCYQEEEVLPLTAPQFLAELEHLIAAGKADPASQICLVNDGSTDGTWDLVKSLAASNPHFCGISLRRNCGHQLALFTGLMMARERCDISISVDCDGQDDITATRRMVDEYLSGADIVYGVRSNRDSDSFFKRFTAEAFYHLVRLLGSKAVYNAADYRLMSKPALDALSRYEEENLFLRGLAPLLGFPSSTVEYDRAERIAGNSHYSLAKMLRLALDGVRCRSAKARPQSAARPACLGLVAERTDGFDV